MSTENASKFIRIPDKYSVTFIDEHGDLAFTVSDDRVDLCVYIPILSDDNNFIDVLKYSVETLRKAVESGVESGVVYP